MQITILNIVFLASLVLTLSLAGLDYLKKRKVINNPFISFVMPSYNDAAYLEKSIGGIFKAYNPKKFELFVINDRSTDNTLEILNRLKRKYKFTLINNEKNKGKATSINDTFPKTKGEIIFVVDSDTIISKEGVNDILARFDSNSKVAGVSCRYKPLNNHGVLPTMQDIEYNVLTMVQAAHNPSSTVALWGGCMAIKRKQFEEVGLLSSGKLTEDLDLALKLNHAGYKVEQSYVPSYTIVPSTVRAFYRQKLRWSGGFMQGFVTYPKVYFRNPLILFFSVSYSLVILLFLISAIKDIILFSGVYSLIKATMSDQVSFLKAVSSLVSANSTSILNTVYNLLIYPLSSLPYLLIEVRKVKEIPRLLLIYPFSWVYYPIYTLLSIGGFIYGLYKLKTTQKRKSGWATDH